MTIGRPIKPAGPRCPVAEIVDIQRSEKPENQYDKWSFFRRGVKPKKCELTGSACDDKSLPKNSRNVDAKGPLPISSARSTILGTDCVDFTTDAVTIPPRLGHPLARRTFFDNLVGWF